MSEENSQVTDDGFRRGLRRFRGALPKAVTDRIPGPDAGKGVVAVVRLHGVIAAGPGMPGSPVLNAASVESSLKAAFAHEDLVAVALLINSPGGAPTQSELIARRIRGLADEKDVPVLAFCEDVAASGGYWIACAADEIHVAATSAVGSIGIVSSGFGFADLIGRVGVDRRLHTTGEAKARLDPFLPEKDEDVAWLEGIQGRVFEEFTTWVRGRRGDRLVGEEADLFTGDVWIGADAVARGLADGVGYIREVVAERWPGARLVRTTGPRSLAQRLGLPGAAASSWVDAVADSFERRGAWARYGL